MRISPSIRIPGLLAGLGVTAATLVAVTPPAAADVVPCVGLTPTIVATADGERLQGTDGPDVISIVGFDRVQVDAGGGDDVVCSTAWTSAVVRGGPGADMLVDRTGPKEGIEDATQLYGGPGADQLRGALYGRTIAAFTGAPAGVTIRLDDRKAVDEGDTDSLEGIRSVIGSPYRDTFVGSDGNDRYTSSDDYLVETDGDVIRTGAGDDRVWAFSSSVDLGPGHDEAAGTGSRIVGGTGNDRIRVETSGTALGGPGRDELSGGADMDSAGPGPSRISLLGGAGNDRLFLPSAYADSPSAGCPRYCTRSRVDGEQGSDTLALVWRRSVIDLGAGRARAQGGRASLGSVENVVGSRYADVVRGSARANLLVGRRGDDVLLGRGGADTLVGDRGQDRADGGQGRDRCVAEVRTSC
ncbi:MAG TPA: calcium-binding protein [Nocardioides sp.]|uniref:calcium-binding protein n=1 Tax=Nocardioides sp. TaxID=35761 RepID=UPI002BD04BFB|nr:calcium-binding protein [Nocardioides sp.]HTW14527.1 calcium-binding protein [Nocardioides sp.]